MADPVAALTPTLPDTPPIDNNTSTSYDQTQGVHSTPTIEVSPPKEMDLMDVDGELSCSDESGMGPVSQTRAKTATKSQEEEGAETTAKGGVSFLMVDAHGRAKTLLKSKTKTNPSSTSIEGKPNSGSSSTDPNIQAALAGFGIYAAASNNSHASLIPSIEDVQAERQKIADQASKADEDSGTETRDKDHRGGGGKKNDQTDGHKSKSNGRNKRNDRKRKGGGGDHVDGNGKGGENGDSAIQSDGNDKGGKKARFSTPATPKENVPSPPSPAVPSQSKADASPAGKSNKSSSTPPHTASATIATPPSAATRQPPALSTFKPAVPSPLSKSASSISSKQATSVNGDDRIEIDDSDEEEDFNSDVKHGNQASTRGSAKSQHDGQGRRHGVSEADDSDVMDVDVTEHVTKAKANGRKNSNDMVINFEDEQVSKGKRVRTSGVGAGASTITPTVTNQMDQQMQLLQLMSLLQQQKTPKEKPQKSSKRRSKSSSSKKHKNAQKGKRSKRGMVADTDSSASDSDSDSGSESDQSMDSDKDSRWSGDDSSDSDTASDSSIELVDKHSRRVKRYSKRDLKRKDKGRRSDKYAKAKSSSRRHRHSISRKHRVKDNQKAEKHSISKASKGKGKEKAVSTSPAVTSEEPNQRDSFAALGEEGRSVMQHAPEPYDPPGVREAVVANPSYPEQRHPRLILPKDQRGNDMSLVVWNDKLHTMDDALKPILKWSWVGDEALGRMGNVGWKIGGTGAKVDENGQYYQNEYFETAEVDKDTIWHAKVTIILPPTHPTLKNHAEYNQLPKDCNDPTYAAMARHLGGVRDYEDKEGARLRGDSQNKAIQLAVSLNVLSFLTCCPIGEQASQSSTNLNKIQFHQSPSSFAPGMIASPFALAGSGKLDFMSGYIADAPKPISRAERKLQERLRRDHNRKAMDEIAPEGEATERARAEMEQKSAGALEALQQKPTLTPFVKSEYPTVKTESPVVKREMYTPGPMGGYRGLASREAANTPAPSVGYSGIASITHPTHGDLTAPATAPSTRSGYSAFGSGGTPAQMLGPLERRLAREDRLLAKHQQVQVKQELQPLEDFDAEKAIRRACQQNDVQFSVKTEQVDGSYKSIAHLKLTAKDYSQAVYATVKPVSDPLEARAEVYQVAYRAGAVEWIVRSSKPLMRPAETALPGQASSVLVQQAQKPVLDSQAQTLPIWDSLDRPTSAASSTDIQQQIAAARAFLERHTASSLVGMNAVTMSRAMQGVAIASTTIAGGYGGAGPTVENPPPQASRSPTGYGLVVSENDDPVEQLKALSMRLHGYIPMYGHQWENGSARVWLKAFGRNYPDKIRYATVEEGYRSLAAKVLRKVAVEGS